MDDIERRVGPLARGGHTLAAALDRRAISFLDSFLPRVGEAATGSAVCSL
jgi:hypothetical protein